MHERKRIRSHVFMFNPSADTPECVRLAAEAVGVSESVIRSWMRGESSPTESEAQSLERAAWAAAARRGHGKAC